MGEDIFRYTLNISVANICRFLVCIVTDLSCFNSFSKGDDLFPYNRRLIVDDQTTLSKKKKLVSSFFNSRFNYFPLIWMFRSRIINNKINHLHERCLRLLCGDKSSPFEKLLKQDKSVTIHTRNLQILATEMFKVYQNIYSPIFSEIFHWRDINYNLRINPGLVMSNVRSIFHGSKSIFYLSPKIWDIVPLELKKLTSVVAFKKGNY